LRNTPPIDCFDQRSAAIPSLTDLRLEFLSGPVTRLTVRHGAGILDHRINCIEVIHRMSDLGRLLREARIRQKYLEALENGEFAMLPRGAVARGFLRTYAAFLGLDVADTLKRYTQESGDNGDEVEIAEPGKPRLVDYRPLEVKLHYLTPAARWWPWVIALVVVIAAGAGVLWLLNRNQGWNFLAAFGPASTATATVTVTATQTATPLVVIATSEPSPTLVLPAPTSDLLPLPTPTVPPTITPTPRPTATPEVVASIALSMTISQKAWMRVVVDGVIEEGTLEAGTTRAWEAETSISVRTGNGGGVSLTLNGENLGLMGAIGQVVERTWIVDQGEVTETTTGTPVPTPAPTRTPTSTPAG
jgi:cytoskeletal protein RodZ